ncbi:MAG: PASTA domain-containing protein [Prolixibacteraceae bacterium]|nr:PASTA domain-containing protein [Prolixibacteraceae bacterium]
MKIGAVGFWVLKNLIIAVVIAIFLILITMFSIRVYTKHGESLTVPDFSGMQEDQVRKILEKNELNYQVTDSLYVLEEKPGTVIGQFPVKDSHVKSGRTIFFTICARKPEQISMPKLTDISLRQAMNILSRVGLNVGTITYVPSEYPNLVLAQTRGAKDIEQGLKVNKGTGIDLTVGKSLFSEKTVIPDLIGLTLKMAKNEMVSLFLVQGSLIYDESVKSREDTLNARIFKQDPDLSGENLKQGSSIDMWFTIDEEKLKNVEAVADSLKISDLSINKDNK